MVELNREFLINKYGKDELLEETNIILINNRINKVDLNAFRNLKHLKELSLFGNDIPEIEANVFVSLSNLTSLFLYENQLNKIDCNAFKGLKNLEKLWLSDNKISEIEEKTFESLSNLKELWLDSNKLRLIDSNAFKGLGKLERLRLNNNRIVDIDCDAFEGLSNLEMLWLDNNRLAEIDRKCFEPLKSIEVICLYENEMTGPSFLSHKIKRLNEYYYREEKLTEYGFQRDWNLFLENFPLVIVNRNISSKSSSKRSSIKGNKFLINSIDFYILKLPFIS